jgi:hypothetical protein
VIGYSVTHNIVTRPTLDFLCSFHSLGTQRNSFSISSKENGFFSSQNLLDPLNAPASFSVGTGGFFA